jgi:hypothetical protein
MAKITREAVEAVSALSVMTTDQFFNSIIDQWDRLGDMAATLVASAAMDGIEPEHEDIVKDVLRVGVRCAALKGIIKLAMAEPWVIAACEPSDTELDIQLAEVRAEAARLQEREP